MNNNYAHTICEKNAHQTCEKRCTLDLEDKRRRNGPANDEDKRDKKQENHVREMRGKG